MEPQKVTERIRKLLALAQSPNENEARSALLRARELMAQHKLSESDLADSQRADQKLVTETIGVTCTSRTNTWRRQIAGVIAENYSCITTINYYGRSQTYEIGLAGLEEDFAVCKQAILYAIDCVDSYNRELEAAYKHIYQKSYITKLKESYGWGFAKGLSAAFRQQTEEKQQEWGLVMCIPTAVKDIKESIGSARTPKQTEIKDDLQYLQQYRGYADGKCFVEQKRIE